MKIGEALGSARKEFRPGVARAYPKVLRRQAVKYFEREFSRGKKREQIAQELGVHPGTLDVWRQQSVPSTRVRFKPVLVKEHEREKLTVRAGSLVIEGLDVEQLCELLRAMG